MEESYETFCVLQTKELDELTEAVDIYELLEENMILYRLWEPVSQSFVSSTESILLKTPVELKVRPADFEAVKILIEDYKRAEVEVVHDDHYILSFSEQELRDVVMKQDEWSKSDILLARKLLADRGIIFSETEIELAKEKRKEFLQGREKNQAKYGWLYFFIGVGAFLLLFLLIWLAVKYI